MKKLLSSLFILLLVAISAMGQDRTVTGTVTASEDGLPLPGVSVKVIGGTLATQTNASGRFSLTVPSTARSLEFSFIGYASQTIAIAANNVVNAVLVLDAKQLGEVVVTGYQTVNRKDVTGAVSVVDGVELAQKPIVSFTQLLQGTASGLQVTGASGRPGANAYIRIRGTGSITASAEPLILVDGVQVTTAAYSGLNPNDIDQITVLKDAAASAIYGSRAGNGVIVITTKQGQPGQPVLSYSFQTGISKAQDLQNVKLMDSQQKLQYEYELKFQNPSLDTMILNRITAGTLPPNADIFNVTATQRQNLWDLLISRGAGDWRKVLLQDAVSNKHEISLSGGADKVKYFMSLNSNNNEGTERYSNFDRKGGRLNVEYRAKDWFRLGTNLGVTNSAETQVREAYNTQNSYASTYFYNPYEQVYNADGTYNITSQGFSSLEGAINNPTLYNRINTFGTFFGEASFLKHLTLRSQLGMNYNTMKYESYTKPGSNLAVLLGYNQKNDQGNQDLLYVFTNTANWNQTIGEKHSINALVGTEYNRDKLYSYSLTGRSFPTASVSTLENAATPITTSTSVSEFAMISYFGNLTYDFSKRYFLTLSGRRDGSSRFGANNRFADFYAVGLSWDIKNEKFFTGVNWVSDLKLRGSIGTAGNNNIGNYDALGTYSLTTKYNDQTAAVPFRLPNPNLTWETGHNKDVGLTFGLFDSRITGEIDYYNRENKNLLYNINVSTTTGFGSYVGNIGAVKNTGIEVSLDGAVLRKKDFSWNVNVNYTHNDNKITQLYSDNVLNTTGAASIAKFVIGQPINTYYLVNWAGIDPATGKNRFYNIDGTTTTTYNGGQAQLQTGKSPNVKYYGTVGTNLSYKGFDLGARLYYSGGNYIMNYMWANAASDGESVNNNQYTEAFDYWKKPGDNVMYANPLDASQNVTYDTDKYLQKGDYISLRDVTLSYTVSNKYAKYIKAKNLRLFMQGTNLFLISKFKGLPEVGESNRERTDNPGVLNLYGYPQLKAYTFGVDVRF